MPKRYVELDNFIRTVKATPRCDLGTALCIANNYSTADVAEVVRCKDCKHFVSEICRHDFAMNLSRADHFCSYGERRS